jgi:hypothetical protein
MVGLQQMSKEQPSAKVIHFPPLPRIPTPPRFPPDARQQQTGKIINNIAQALKNQATIVGPNLVDGFPASAVDLGRLQEVLEQGLQRLEWTQIAERWDEVQEWMSRLLQGWVQRNKMVKFDRRENGIAIELQTQDDWGYYRYVFDIFPGRNAPKKNAP